jgi:hypothetical protein
MPIIGEEDRAAVGGGEIRNALIRQKSPLAVRQHDSPRLPCVSLRALAKGGPASMVNPASPPGEAPRRICAPLRTRLVQCLKRSTLRPCGE